MSDIQGLLNKYKGIPDERFFSDIFERQEYRSAREVKADIIVDIGALAGEFGAYMYDKAKIIYAIEAYPPHYEELVSNIEEFGLNKIKPYQLAIGDSNKEGHLRIKGRGANMLADSGEPVHMVTLATFMKYNNIDHVDVLKIDIEGMDKSVFKSEDFLTVADKISFIIGEHIGDMKEFFQPLGFLQKVEHYNTIYYK